MLVLSVCTGVSVLLYACMSVKSVRVWFSFKFKLRVTESIDFFLCFECLLAHNAVSAPSSQSTNKSHAVFKFTARSR